MSDYFLIYREVDKGGRLVKRYLFWQVGDTRRWSWRNHRPGAARFHTLLEAMGWARRWLGAKIERRT